MKLLIVTGCKTTSSNTNDTSGTAKLDFGPTFTECGPGKTLYFHWLDQETAMAWQKLASVAQPLPDEKDLTPRTATRQEINAIFLHLVRAT